MKCYWIPMGLRFGTLGVTLVLVACGSSSSGGGSGGSGGSPDGSTAGCAVTVAEQCKANVCPVWSDTAGLCAANITLGGDCGSYHLGIDQGTDTQTRYYFGADGKLVAIVHYNANSMQRTCSAGPAGFTEPDCGRTQTLTPICASDAGAG